MSGHKIIVIGASAGGVEALMELVKLLPPDIPAAIFVVLHIPSHSTSVLPNILNRAGSIKASHPRDHTKIESERIYIAPPDYHLLVKLGYIQLTRGPRENSHRPAIDPLFRSAARAYGAHVVGLVLSGTLDDGTAGLMAIKLAGGVAVVQDPDEATFVGMPSNAIENVQVDYILPIVKIALLLVDLANQPVETEANSLPEEIALEVDAAETEPQLMQDDGHPGEPSSFACPDCGGVLWELNNGDLLRFRCRTGHAFSPASLLAKQSEALEEALWSALRALEEQAALAERMVRSAQQRHHYSVAQRFKDQVEDARQRAAIIRQVLCRGEGIPTAEPGVIDQAIPEISAVMRII